MKWYEKVGKCLSDWIYKYVGSLVMEEKEGRMVMSIGRVLLLIVTCAMVWVWRRAVLDAEVVELPPGMLQVFYALLGYVLGGKAVKAIRMRYQDGKLSQLDMGAESDPGDELKK